MKSIAAAVLASALCAGVADAQTQAAPPVNPIRPSKIILVGDSTTAVIGGWGPSFCADHVTSFLACVNLARGGRSTSNYRAEGSWDVALGEMSTPGYVETYVLIQFGHNDQPGKPGRSTDLVTQFPANLDRYISEAQVLGGVPVLVTPLTRRSFKGPWLRDDLAPWADAARKVAAHRKVALLDLNRLSADAVQAMGSEQADTLAQEPPPAAAASTLATGAAEPQGAPKSAFDRTHVGAKGAALFSGMVAAELQRLFPTLAPYFKAAP